MFPNILSRASFINFRIKRNRVNVIAKFGNYYYKWRPGLPPGIGRKYIKRCAIHYKVGYNSHQVSVICVAQYNLYDFFCSMQSWLIRAVSVNGLWTCKSLQKFIYLYFKKTLMYYLRKLWKVLCVKHVIILATAFHWPICSYTCMIQIYVCVCLYYIHICIHNKHIYIMYVIKNVNILDIIYIYYIYILLYFYYIYHINYIYIYLFLVGL